MHLPNIGVVNVGFSGNVFNVIKSISSTGAPCGLIKQSLEIKIENARPYRVYIPFFTTL